MKKVLLSCLAVAAGSAMAMAQAIPEYPDKLDLTINGEKELSGVTVTQEMVPFDGEDYLTITVTGECDANEITIDMMTPEGWDSMLTFSEYGESGDIEPLKAKAKAPAKEGEEYWTPLMFAGWIGFEAGNTITFPVDGDEHQAMALLVKGDEYYTINIDFIFEVSKVGGSIVPDDPEVPEVPEYPTTLNYTFNGEKELAGVSVSETLIPYDGTQYLRLEITGESTADAITMDFETPEGWDYALISSMTDDGGSPWNTRSGSSDHWVPVKTVTSMGYKKGNSFEFPVNGKDSYGTIYLVKGDQVWEYSIDIEFNVSKAGASQESYNVSTSCPSLEVTHGEVDGFYLVTVTGECPDDEYTVTVETPEGYDGFIGYTDCDYSYDIEPLKKIQDPDWVPVEEMLEDGLKITNTLTFPADGEEHWGQLIPYKGDVADVANGIGIEVLVSKAESDEPAYPKALDYTINGEKELAGVTVTQELDGDSLTIDVKGKTDAEHVALTFATPEGWDGLLIQAPFAEVSEQEYAKTRSAEDWMPIEWANNIGYEAGNTVTFEVDGLNNFAYIGLVKGDQVYQSTIAITFDVTKSADEPGEDPVFPESFIVNTFNNDLEVWQGMEYGAWTIKVEGEVTESTFPIVIDVPEGWDGFISANWSQDKVIISENNPNGPRRTRAEEAEWVPISELDSDPIYELLDIEFVKGNSFTFQPTFIPGYNNYQTVEMYLYKGDMALYKEISLEVFVSKKEVEAPVFPESFEVNVSAEGLNVTQGEEYYVYTINVEGACQEETFDVTVEVPEGWDGFIGMTSNDFEQPEIEPLKKAQATEWYPMDEMLEAGMRKTNTLTFYANGEEQMGYLYLYKGDMVDAANVLQICVEVARSEETALTFPDEFDVTLSSPGLTVSQELEVYHGQSQFVITIEGKCSENELTVSLAVPEGWDGFYGASDYEDPSEIEPLSTRSELNENLWMPTYIMDVYGYKKCDSLKFNVDGEEHGGYLFLYKGDEVYYCAILIEDLVMPSTVGVDSVESATSARYFTLQGAEVANPESGVYVKVVNGKSYKVVVK